jgi:RimJ/RimL family protein N-acetyltransferase
MNTITTRPLSPTEWVEFRDFRLQALRAAPGVFHSSHDVEVTNGPEQWQRMLASPTSRIFGLFDEEHLVGITAVFPSSEDPSGKTAIFAMSFILPEYRGRGLSRLLYKARLDWIRSQGVFKRIVVSHRASNEASRRAMERHGFLPTRSAPRTWPDGTVEDELFYELRISATSVLE